jgi:hypothetical protein
MKYNRFCNTKYKKEEEEEEEEEGEFEKRNCHFEANKIK